MTNQMHAGVNDPYFLRLELRLSHKVTGKQLSETVWQLVKCNT